MIPRLCVERRRPFHSRVLILGFAAAAVAGRTDAAPPPRVPWTTSRVAGSPEPPPPLRTKILFPGVRFEHPVAIAMPPGDGRWWVAEQTGKVFRIDPRDQGRAELALDLKPELAERTQPDGPRIFDSLYGLTFHPQFEENRQVFLAYTVVTGEEGKHLNDGTRVSRFRVSDTNPPRVEPASEEIVLTFLEGGHNGACLDFGPDGCLYISTGDGEGPSPPDIRATGQDNTDLLSSILRIDVDHPSDGRAYSIPADNPFVGIQNCLPEIWAYGFRNPWKMSFDRQTGGLWVGDVGWELWELVHKVERGGNYGWSVVEGRQPVRPELDSGPSPISPPVLELPHTMAASITGGFVYRGSRFPELTGHYIFGDWETKRIWSWPVEPPTAGEAPVLRDLVDPSIRIIAFGQDHQGELCVLDYDAGTLHAFERNDEVGRPRPAFPTRLSETGLFASVTEHHVAPGVIPFNVRVVQWSDGTTAERFLAIPGDERIVWHPNPVEVPGSMFSRQLDYPENSVLMKTLSLPADRFNPRPRRVETQLLHYDGRQWRGYSYRWNDAQTDAALVAADGDEAEFPIEVPGAPDDRRTLHWTFASRSQCLVCHNPWAESTLAFNLDQLGPTDAAPTSTWDELCAMGVIQSQPATRISPENEETKPAESRLVDAFDRAQPVETRARSYLHANCSHCHREGGGGAVQIDLRVELAPDKMKAIDALPLQGSLGLEDARIVAPGDPFRSVLLLRMAKTGRGRMPHLGSERPDEAALELIEEWIRSLSPETDSPGFAAAAATLGAAREQPRGAGRDKILSQGLTASPNVALAIARMMHDSPLEMKREIAEMNQKPGNDLARDLFTKYLPEPAADRVGTLIRPTRILQLKGDAARGKELFWKRQDLNCKTCHRVGEEGGQAGPELTRIGAAHRRAELLESLLEPSRSIDPKFATFAVQTADGRVLAGVVVKRDAESIELRDAKGELVVVPAADIEAIRPQRASLMPEGLLKDLTLHEAADILAYLEGLTGAE